MTRAQVFVYVLALSLHLSSGDSVMLTLGDCITLRGVSSEVYFVDTVLGVLGNSPQEVCFPPGFHHVSYVLHGKVLSTQTIFVRQPPRTRLAMVESLLALEIHPDFSARNNSLHFYATNIPIDAKALADPSLDMQATYNPSHLAASLGQGKLTVGISRHGTISSLHWPGPTHFDHLEFFAFNTTIEPYMGAYTGIMMGDNDVSWLKDWSLTSQQYLTPTDNILVSVSESFFFR